MNCKQCGAENPQGQAYCWRCGAPVGVFAPPPVQQAVAPPYGSQNVPFSGAPAPAFYSPAPPMPVYSERPVPPPPQGYGQNPPLYGQGLPGYGNARPVYNAPQWQAPMPGAMPTGYSAPPPGGWAYGVPAAPPAWQPKKMPKKQPEQLPLTPENAVPMLTVKQCFRMLLLGLLPVAGLILCLVWVYGNAAGAQKKNLAKGMLLLHAIALALLVLWLAIWVAGLWGALPGGV